MMLRWQMRSKQVRDLRHTLLKQCHSARIFTFLWIITAFATLE
jgi:hypothetical protein